VVLEALAPNEIFIAGFLGSVSTATADTLATEIGLLYPSKPRLSIDLRTKVPPGTSGAISPLGILATVLGSMVIGMVSGVLGVSGLPYYKVFLLATVAGTAGSLVDSLVGATLQSVYRCEDCGRMTEETEHCGDEPVKLKGYRSINNDTVNVIASTFGSITAIVLFFL